jgi:general secretion pathway protein M
MSLKTSLAGPLQQAGQFWSERNPRERRMLAAGIAAIFAALVYLLLIAPAQSGLQRYQRSLPELRQQVAQLQSMAQEAVSLPQGDVAAPPPLSREMVEASLARRGLKAQSVTIAGDTARLQLTAVSFTSLLDWIADSRSAAQMVVSEASLTAQAQPDLVSGSIALRQQRGQ